MNRLNIIDTQTLCDIQSSARLHLLDPANKTFREMAYSSAGYIFSDSADFTDRVAAFGASGCSLIEIISFTRNEIQKRIT